MEEEEERRARVRVEEVSHFKSICRAVGERLWEERRGERVAVYRRALQDVKRLLEGGGQSPILPRVKMIVDLALMEEGEERGEEMDTIRKGEIVRVIARDLGLTQRDVRRVIDRLLLTVANHVAGGGKVVLTGFGSWSPRWIRPSSRRTPTHDHDGKTEGRYTVGWRPSRSWVEMMDKLGGDL